MGTNYQAQFHSMCEWNSRVKLKQEWCEEKQQAIWIASSFVTFFSLKSHVDCVNAQLLQRCCDRRFHADWGSFKFVTRYAKRFVSVCCCSFLFVEMFLAMLATGFQEWQCCSDSPPLWSGLKYLPQICHTVWSSTFSWGWRVTVHYCRSSIQGCITKKTWFGKEAAL